jgi:hypothetical protein
MFTLATCWNSTAIDARAVSPSGERFDPVFIQDGVWNVDYTLQTQGSYWSCTETEFPLVVLGLS